MPQKTIKQIADDADMIVRGYAFTKEAGHVRILNINDGLSGMLIAMDGTILETNMDEIEQALVERIWQRDSKYLENWLCINTSIIRFVLTILSFVLYHCMYVC